MKDDANLVGFLNVKYKPIAPLKLITFTKKGIYCPQGKFYIDPWRPVDLAVITHGHADHARWGMKKYLCHHYTKPILYQRIGVDIECQSVEYGETITLNGVKLSMHPAGHIIGSAQIRLEYKGYVTVISGDYKVQEDGLSTPFELVKCNEFVTESTFGLPIYNWLEVPELNKKLQSWVLKNQENSKTSVFIGYSLGKAQRIMKAVEGLGKIYVHNSIGRLNEAFESVGITLPDYKIADFKENPKEVQHGIVIVPPALLDSNIIKKIPDAATAICSGWMQVRGARRWRSADAGFAMSDHADWKGLLQAVKATEAEIVHVTHGQTEIFSKYLNEIGIKSDVVETLFGEDEEESEKETIENPEP
ncbi:F0F1-type ATP synthase, epsilon subunit (mitochondrial delta subunit) [Chryseobacterium carnipullorum]|uniref:F0F1-type ATP synthase, epsilon subunit (Mitochondrial delta subunit) n=1 Tax=Chryseobacterium carnipullorum TaxID=1124835 RepID=A0A376DYM5_CHRCU|nr:F0F1-type ATP synthase, epsilon subunit (mitochondrial delta subunit) [Chryseobacterium carnipullorum]